ncbi:MAG: hypothetical protein IJK06_02300 [Clostridia bacterium]|nr:hypothetical protein [Clostridia bacterium]
MNNTSSAYITVKDYNQTYHFTGVLSVTHSLSLKVFEKADATELGSFVNGAKNQPDKVTLSVLETDAAHSAAGWATRMLDVLESVKRNRLLCRVVTQHHTYDDMLLTGISVTQDEEHPDGWAGDLTFTEYIPMAILGETKTDDNASTPTNTGSTAPAKKDSGVAAKVDYGAAPAASAGAFITGFLSLQNGSSLEQKIARAGIDTDSIRYIV